MKFSTKEIIDMAVKIEDTGYTFYTECARKFGASKKEAADMFTMLAGEELKHRDYFSGLLDTIQTADGVYDDSYYAYLKALTATQVFRDVSDIGAVVSNVRDIADVLTIGLQTEKDSIIWYTELARLYGKDDEKALSVLDTLIGEEKRHIVLIYSMMKDISILSK